MTKKKEQLSEEVVEETPKEEDPVEKVTEESKEEVTEEIEKPAEEEESTEEESIEETEADEKNVEEESIEKKIEEVEELDVENEQLNIEIKQTKEELAVIKEVRDELVKLYSDYKQVEQLKEDVVTENEQLKADVEMLSTKLYDYKVAEEKLEAEQKLQRLEKLSVKFTALGQSKSVEYLSGKDSETLSEFEKIVDAALDRVGDTSEMPSVTNNTQTEKVNDVVKSEENKTSEEITEEKPKEQLSNENFFENLCSTLSNQQTGNSSGKRIKLM